MISWEIMILKTLFSMQNKHNFIFATIHASFSPSVITNNKIMTRGKDGWTYEMYGQLKAAYMKHGFNVTAIQEEFFPNVSKKIIGTKLGSISFKNFIKSQNPDFTGGMWMCDVV